MIIIKRFYDDIPKSINALYRVANSKEINSYFRTEKQAMDFINKEELEVFYIEKLLFVYNLNSIMNLCNYISETKND